MLADAPGCGTAGGAARGGAAEVVEAGVQRMRAGTGGRLFAAEAAWPSDDAAE